MPKWEVARVTVATLDGCQHVFDENSELGHMRGGFGRCSGGCGDHPHAGWVNACGHGSRILGSARAAAATLILSSQQQKPNAELRLQIFHIASPPPSQVFLGLILGHSYITTPSNA